MAHLWIRPYLSFLSQPKPSVVGIVAKGLVTSTAPAATAIVSVQSNSDNRENLPRDEDSSANSHAMTIADRTETDSPKESIDTDQFSDELPADGLGPCRYMRLRSLGRGGFGVVYLARDIQLDRIVALKQPRTDVLLTNVMLQRFLREAQNVAKLDHPNIVPLIGTDETGPLPYIIYHYCNGPTLSQWLNQSERPKDPKTVARIGMLLAEAVHHAHSRGILHRDLKPSNVLLESGNATELRHGFHDATSIWIPRVTDFGISKVILDRNASDQTSDAVNEPSKCHQVQQLTVTDAVMGTLEYMSPEQVSGRAKDIGTHSDVYSLGVILYELLVREKPFRGRSAYELMKAMSTSGPTSLRKLRSEIPRDLEAIVLRCLNTSVTDRYSTAAALAEDLSHFLEDRVVSAQSPSTFQRLRKWARRQPLVASLSATCVLLTIVAATATVEYLRSTSAYIRELSHSNELLEKERDRAREENERADRLRTVATETAQNLGFQLYASDVAAAGKALRDGDMAQYHSLLERHVPTNSENDLREVTWHHLWKAGHRDHKQIQVSAKALYSIRFSHDAAMAVTCGADGLVRVFDSQTQQPIKSWDAQQGEVNCAEFSKDSSRIVTTGDDGTAVVWDFATLKPLLRIQAHTDRAYQALYLDDRRLITCGNDNHIRIWDAESGTSLACLSQHQRSVQSLALSSDGKRLFSAGDDGIRCIWNLETLELERTLDNVNSRCLDVQISRTGGQLFSSDVRGRVRCEHLGSTTVTSEILTSMPDCAESIALSPDESRIAIASKEGAIRILAGVQNSSQSNSLFHHNVWMAHSDRVFDIAFSRDGGKLHSVGADGTWRIWDQNNHENQSMLRIREFAKLGKDFRLSIHQRGSNECIVVAGDTALRWEPESNRVQRLGKTGAPTTRLLVAPSNELMYLANERGVVSAWQYNCREADCLKPVWHYAWPQGTPFVTGLAYSATRGLIATSIESPLPELRLLDAQTGKLVETLEIPPGVQGNNDGNLAFSMDGKWLAGSWASGIVVWNLQEKTCRQFLGHKQMVSVLCFHPSCRYLLSGSDDRSIRKWDLLTGECLAELHYHKSKLRALACSPDGKTIISNDESGLAILWHVQSGKMLMDLQPIDDHSRLSQDWFPPWLFRTKGSEFVLAEKL